ncbi:MAG: DUF1569 domain-containing protein [Pirellulales bacterium]
MSINTKQVAGRRQLHFDTLDDIVAELDRLEGQPLRSLGNWTVGQNLSHLAAVMNAAIDGADFKAPWIIRLLVPLFKRKLLAGPMPPGFKLPKRAASFMPCETDTAAGFAALRQAIHRLRTENHRELSPVFGSLTLDEWINLHCRHCELHLSFIVPSSS